MLLSVRLKAPMVSNIGDQKRSLNQKNSLNLEEIGNCPYCPPPGEIDLSQDPMKKIYFQAIEGSQIALRLELD